MTTQPPQQPAPEPAPVDQLVAALEGLCNVIHEGRLRPIVGSSGYVSAAVDAAESALASYRAQQEGKS